MMRSSRFHLFCGGFVLFAMCTSGILADTSPTGGETGISGVILVSPSHGGPIRLGVPNTAPLPETEFVVRKGKETAATFKTDQEGKFRVSVPPGHYTVSRANYISRVGSYGPFEVDVVPGRMSQVQWTCDSGMR